MLDLTDIELLFGHTDEDTALVVHDYPYGRQVRTDIRYWIETVAKRGDRFVSQTLNPKTGRWNKPKKSTYLNLGVMYRAPDTGYVRWTGVGDWPQPEDLGRFCAVVGAERLNAEQKKMLAMVVGRMRAFEHVTFSIREGSMTPEEQTAHDAEQSELMGKIWAYAGIKTAEAHRNLTEENS